MNSLIGKDQARDISYSLRRYYVDEFHLRQVAKLEPGSVVLDLGGNRLGKRGTFDLDRFGLVITYANLSLTKKPDVQSDATALPFQESIFDCVICSELLEHVPDPVRVIAEIRRVLKKSGEALICVPFSFPIHADPSDYGRYTGFYWNEVMGSQGFGQILIENQGGFWSVLVDMIRYYTYSRTKMWGAERAKTLEVIGRLLGMLKQGAINSDGRNKKTSQENLIGYTTGFGVRACKL